MKTKDTVIWVGIIAIAMLCCVDASAQNNRRRGNQNRRNVELRENVQIPVEVTMPARERENRIYDVVENPPSFPGGQAACMQWLSSHMQYPPVAEENNIQGRVVVSFVVEKDGSLSNVEVARDVDPALDKEAVRLVRAMPKWNPGTQNDTPVRVKYNFPIIFKLQ